MSIIHDALKKVQQGLDRNKPASEIVETLPSSQENNSNHVKQKPPIPWMNLFISLAILTGTLGYLYYQAKPHIPAAKRWISNNLSKIKINLPKKTVKQREAKPLAKFVITPETAAASTESTATETTPATTAITPATPASKPANITLNIHGVMAQGNTNVALINNNIYEEGDEVDGVKILKINLDAIVVLNNGQEETIKVGK